MIVAPELAVFDESHEGAGRSLIVLLTPDGSESDFLTGILDSRRYRTLACETADAAIGAARDFRAAIIVAVCERADSEALSLCWRAAGDVGAPVILLARQGADPIDRTFALEAGADDMLSWPPDSREFAAVIGARTRRFAPRPQPALQVRQDHWILDSDTRSVLNTGGERVILSRSEWGLLQIFADHRGQVVEAVDAVARLDLNVSNPSVGFRMAVSRLRRKLGDVGASSLIRCVRGEGYMLDGAVQTRGELRETA